MDGGEQSPGDPGESFSEPNEVFRRLGQQWGLSVGRIWN